jgi:methylenetetrahydrofolate dehydrogenase (NADP+)/methenyltetrahydrofolate cyclohydrolase
MILLDGKKIADEKSEELKNSIKSLDFAPKLLIVRVGEDVASDVYVSKKVEFGEKIGAEVQVVHLNENVSNEDVVSEIEKVLFCNYQFHKI